MAGKRTSHEAKSRRVFGQARKQPKMFRAGLYTRVSTNDQQTIPLQIRALRERRPAGLDNSLAGERGRFRCIAALIAFIEEHYAGVFPRERTRDLRGDQSKTGSSRL